MMKYLLVLAGLLCFFSCKKQELPPIDIKGDLVARIAFGSCNKQNKEQILWDDIIAENPDMWIWLGDNIYGDSADPAIMKSKYDLQKEDTDYQELIANTPIYGIWDDHDYGMNNAGKEFSAKDTMRDLMFDFLDVPKTDPAWSRKGGYQSYDIDNDKIKIKLILLDSRYFRDEALKDGGKYIPNLDGSILGNDQWIWLEEELNNLEADLLIIANGIQVIPEEHRFEKWANFPNERRRLFDLLSNTRTVPTVLLSGDRHLSEVSKIEGQNSIYEITSSGMTHTYSSFVSEPNKFRIGEVVTKKSYGLLSILKQGNDFEIFFDAKGDGGESYLQIPLVY